MRGQETVCLAGCDYASVEQVNRDTLNPLLTALTGTAFMRYFKTTLYCDCPLWPDDGMCAMRDCSVCECEDDEVPKPWKLAESGHVKVACQASGAGPTHL
jgi:ERO1-like protein alpha